MRGREEVKERERKGKEKGQGKRRGEEKKRRGRKRREKDEKGFAGPMSNCLLRACICCRLRRRRSREAPPREQNLDPH